MPGLLATEIATEATHLFDDIAVTDRGPVQPDPLPVKAAFEAEIGHDGCDQRIAGEATAALQAQRDQRHQLVAVEDDAALVGHDQPVGIAIESDPDIGTPRQHLPAHLLGRESAAFTVDVEPIRRHRDREHLGAELPEHGRGDLVGSAVRAIDDNAQSIEPQPFGKALLDELDVAAGRIVEPLGAAELGRDSAPLWPLAERGFDLRLEFIGQLVAIRTEELDPVIGKRVVRGRDDDPDIGPQAARQHRDRRGRQRPDQDDIHSHRDKAGGQRRFEHVAREPRVLADHDEMLV